MKGKLIYKALLVTALTPVILFAVWCGVRIQELVEERSQIKQDYSELNSIKNGLLSVDAWKEHLAEIVNQQIDAFDFSEEQEDTLKVELNKILNSVITKANSMVNKKQESFNDKVKQFAIHQLIDVDKIRAKVPGLSQTIIDELKKPGSKERLKFLAQDKFAEFAEKTHDSLSNKKEMNAILMKYKVKNQQEFNTMSQNKVDELQEASYYYTFALLTCLFLFLLLWLLLRNQKTLHTPFFAMSVLLALTVLVIGLIAPMIEIDARIKELNFLLIGKPLIFTDQVIFYQSKSILDVVSILIATGKADSVFVGSLILIFSVVFPITKLICTKVFVLGGNKTRRNKFINWFAFKSGKWSMADVMVVAIFMAFIGFKGILDTQMSSLQVHKKTLATVATSETSLQPGVILFVAYVLFGLVLAAILKKITFNENIINMSSLRFRKNKTKSGSPEEPRNGTE